MVCFSPVMDVAVSFCESSEETPDEIFESGICCLEVDTEDLNPSLLSRDTNVSDFMLESYMYKGTIEPELLHVCFCESDLYVPHSKNPDGYFSPNRNESVHMSSVQKEIDGKICDCYEVGNTGKMRLHLEGTFEKDINRESFLLVPLSYTEEQLNEVLDFWLTEQEFELGLPLGQSCSSSGFWAGSKDNSKDGLITNLYDTIVNHVQALHTKEGSLDSKIEAAKQKIFHTSQESKLLFWIGAEFEYSVNLSLCGRVQMSPKGDDDNISCYPSILDALSDWKDTLLEEPELYDKEIAFIRELENKGPAGISLDAEPAR